MSAQVKSVTQPDEARQAERVAKRQQALEEIAVSDELGWDAKDCRTFAARVLHDLARQDAATLDSGEKGDRG
jgi:hypothetical protein